MFLTIKKKSANLCFKLQNGSKSLIFGDNFDIFDNLDELKFSVDPISEGYGLN